MFSVRLWRDTMHPFWLLVVMAMELLRGIDLSFYSYFCCQNCREVEQLMLGRFISWEVLSTRP
jgi:hypothetical protein